MKIHMLRGETPFQAVWRVLEEVNKAYDTHIALELEGGPKGPVHVMAELWVDVVEVDFITEEQWELIKANIQAVADRVLRGSGG